LPYIWGGGEPGLNPDYDSPEQEQFVLTLMLRLSGTANTRVDAGFPHAPFLFPLSDADKGRDWATGFLGGMMVRQDAWSPLMQHRTASTLVTLIMALYKDDPDLLGERVTPKVRRTILERLPALPATIAAFWRGEMPEPLRVVKVGRNDPCPCGSGTKYKKCCGAAA